MHSSTSNSFPTLVASFLFAAFMSACIDRPFPVLVAATFPSSWGTCVQHPLPVEWNYPLEENIPQPIKNALYQADIAVNLWQRRQQTAGLSVGVVYNQTLIWSKGYGLKDLSNKSAGVPDADTIFRIGSIYKVFAVLQLMVSRDQGMVALDDPVNKYVPEFKLKQSCNTRTGNSGITFRQLATHLAGLPRETPCGTNKECKMSHKEAFERISTMRAILPQNSLPIYSNLGFAILGQSLAIIHNKTYSDLIHETIIKKLGLESTFVNPPPSSYQANIAMGHIDTAVEHGGIYGEEVPCGKLCLSDMGWTNPAGSMFSSVRDLGRIISFMFNNRGMHDSAPGQILDGSTIAEMLLPSFINNNREDGFATPWEVYSADGDYMLRTKRGDVPGYASMILMAPELKLGVVVLANCVEHAQYPAQAVTNVLLPAFDSFMSTVARTPPLQPLPFTAFVGTYTVESPTPELKALLVPNRKLSAPKSDIITKTNMPQQQSLFSNCDGNELSVDVTIISSEYITLHGDNGGLSSILAVESMSFVLEYVPEESTMGNPENKTGNLIFRTRTYPGDATSCIQTQMDDYWQFLEFLVVDGVVRSFKMDIFWGTNFIHSNETTTTRVSN